jgi:D-arginine dehydrogenase
MARAGARLRCGAELSGAEREVDGDGQGLWTLVLQDGSQVRARAVVNAAGAWADAVARLCGARPLGIEPGAARPSPLPHPRARTSTAGLP